MTVHGTRSILFLTLCAGAAACSGDRVVRTVDDAGVEIVTINQRPGSYASVGTVASEPDLSLASIDGDPASVFNAVTAVRQFPDGTLLVADGPSGRIGLFDAAGTPLSTLGGQGEFPGLFRTLSYIPLVNRDSIWAWDEAATRMTVFERDGEVARAMRINPPGGADRILRVHVLPDRRILSVASVRAAQRGPPAGGGRHLQRDSLQFSLHDDSGGLIRTLFTMPAGEALQIWQEEGDNAVVGITARVPFGRGAAYAVTPDGIVGGPNDSFELAWRDLEGEIRRVTRFASGDVPVREADVEALRDRWLEEAGDAPQRIEHIEITFSEAPLPPVRPAFGQVLGDGEGRIWVREEAPRPADGGWRWWVFDAEEGIPRGYVDFPSTLEVHEIGAGYVLGVYRDEMGLQHVRRVPLQLRGR